MLSKTEDKMEAVFSEQDFHRAAMRADVDGLLAIPKYEPPRWPIYTVVLTIALSLAGLIGLRHAELQWVHVTCDSRVEVCK